jgi:hypothetical protein
MTSQGASWLPTAATQMDAASPVEAAKCMGCPEYGPRSYFLGTFCFATRGSSEDPLYRCGDSRLMQGLPGGLGERQGGDDTGKGGCDEVEGGRDRVARGRQEGGEDQGRRPAEDGDRYAVAQGE